MDYRIQTTGYRSDGNRKYIQEKEDAVADFTLSKKKEATESTTTTSLYYPLEFNRDLECPKEGYSNLVNDPRFRPIFDEKEGLLINEYNMMVESKVENKIYDLPNVDRFINLEG